MIEGLSDADVEMVARSMEQDIARRQRLVSEGRALVRRSQANPLVVQLAGDGLLYHEAEIERLRALVAKLRGAPRAIPERTGGK